MGGRVRRRRAECMEERSLVRKKLAGIGESQFLSHREPELGHLSCHTTDYEA